MSEQILPMNEATKPIVLQTINTWLIKQEDYLKDFLFTDFKLVGTKWVFMTAPCTEHPVKSDMHKLTDRMCKEFGYEIIR